MGQSYWLSCKTQAVERSQSHILYTFCFSRPHYNWSFEFDEKLMPVFWQCSINDYGFLRY